MRLQSEAVNIIWIVSVGSAVLFFFALAYILSLLWNNRKIIDVQKMKMEEAAKSAERYKALFDHSLAGMMKFSIYTWQVQEANEALLALFGCFSIAEFERCFSALPSSTLNAIRTSLNNDGSISEYEIQTRRADGRELWLLFSARAVEGDTYAYGVVVDITKKEQFEAKVKEQAALLNETQDAIIVTDEAGKISFWNRGAELTYGWNAAEVEGVFLQELLYSSNKGKNFTATLGDVLQFHEWSGENRHIRRDGKEILVESRWRVIEHKNSNKKSLLIVNTDITGKKRLEAQFIQAQKMESIALLTGGIAHDLQNILAPVTMSIGLLRDELKDDTSLNVLRAVEQSAQSGLQLVKNILTYGRGVPGKRVTVEVSTLLTQVLEIVAGGLPPTISVQKEIGDGRWTVCGDASQLKQVFLNICVNGRDAMPKGGILRVKIDSSSINENDVESNPEAFAGSYVVVSITDNGVGIPEDNIAKIFEPFFTTKEGGEGTGLGLSIVAGIVKSHGGFITVESAINRGTTFRVYIPSDK